METKDQEAQARRLVEVLRQRPDEATHQAALGQLADYVAAQLAGQDILALYPEVAGHLDACPECAGAYARLYELEAAGEALPQPGQLPAPNLAFLRTAAGRQQQVELAERLLAAVRRAGNRLALHFSAELLAALRPPPAALALRATSADSVQAPADSERYSQVLLTLEPAEAVRAQLPLSVTAYRDEQQPADCLVEVVVEPPGRGWPDLAGIPVTLVVAGERRRATTDAWGLAAFAGVPVAQLPDVIIEVELDG
ncbi:MAG: hypothetical protein L0332_29480 [Chloroflexi bacterium]|nr:hypothetical protein [Chloroflexota bacterium]MCI0575675.1 hypothetical protein [Chloroflexota bacterium]MCI0647522.1 hypothetical protein [Chloroflexota bacterium]MCI0730833.1 hypothetical protein [Chloroflexota bacterium]